MTSERRLELDLPLILEDLSMAPYPDYIDDVLALSARRRQKPWWASLERWLPMDLAARPVYAPRMAWRLVALAALLVALIVGAALVGSQRTRLPSPFGLAANGLIPYTVDGDIFLGDPVTGTSRLILDGSTPVIDPAFDRRGQTIAFLREDPLVPSIANFFVMDQNGSNLREVGPDVGARSLRWWDWTGDDRLIVVSGMLGPGFTVFDPTGRRATLRLATDFLVEGPMVRPGGDEVVFRGQQGNQFGIFVINLDGTGLRAIVAPRASANPEFELYEPKWSPDGTRIAYHEWDSQPGRMRTFVVNADGTGKRELGAGADLWFVGWPIWSNDGTRLAVQRGRDVPEGQSGAMPYGIVDVHTDEMIETGPVLPEGGARIDWAPDDSWILAVPNDAEADIVYLLDPAGGPWRELPWQASSYPNWQRLAPSG